jgi:3-oxoacyl-[acyl-carrier protein] reductase
MRVKMVEQKKTVLVTGASRGIGRATASALAETGAHVLVHYGRSGQEAKSLVSEIETKGGSANAISPDLGTPNGAALLAEQVRSLVSDRLDVLVLNAGISKAARITDYTVEDFDNLFATNVRSPFFLVQQLLPVLGERSNSVLISSAVARTVVGKPGLENPSILAYASTKGAIETLVKHWAAILGPRGIRVKANRQAGGRSRCSRVLGFGQGTLDHRCQCSRRWRLEAVTNTVRSTMETKASKGKDIRIPGPDHPITISPAAGTVRVTVAGRIVAESTRALRLEEKGYPPVYYLPRNDADMSLLVRTKHYTYCPYKGDCTYYSIPIGGTKSEYAVWTY